MKQTVFMNAEKKTGDVLLETLRAEGTGRLFVVCGMSCRQLEIAEEIARLPAEMVWFHDFSPNPGYDSVVKGVELFKSSDCAAVLAIGGGSAMDVAKCIKLFAAMDETVNYLRQEPAENGIPLIAIPTTAGTGSEATRYAVIYDEGEKQSVTHPSIIPKYVFLNADVLDGLPLYQKKVTVMDALCHAVESFWSVHSTEESRAYSREAVQMITGNLTGYLEGKKEAAGKMLLAANTAGKAINIAQTTAGHAMCYKITSLYGISHGHAAALCVERLWPYMVENMDKCLDYRGVDYLKSMFAELADAFGCITAQEAAAEFSRLLDSLELEAPGLEKENRLEELADSVNLTRFKNNPVKLEKDDLRNLYRSILGG